MKLPTLPWSKLLAEGALIIVSVYLAIVLEGMSQDRVAEKAAYTALAQMLDEMREDRSDVGEIRAEQIERDGQYRALIQWLASPESMPLDSVGGAMDAIFMSNRTLYPRLSAWTTMVAAGQLADLNDPALVTQLGNFYESVTVRIIDNGQDYDENLNEIERNSVTEIWDAVNGRLLTTDVHQLTVFRNQLRYMHLGWNAWYLDRMEYYERTLDSLIIEIESYLKEHVG
jgi:hypothetical protein